MISPKKIRQGILVGHYQKKTEKANKHLKYQFLPKPK